MGKEKEEPAPPSEQETQPPPSPTQRPISDVECQNQQPSCESDGPCNEGKHSDTATATLTASTAVTTTTATTTATTTTNANTDVAADKLKSLSLSLSSAKKSRAVPMATAMSSGYEKDWHAEVLCGLFLRSEEQELERLERDSIRSRTSGGENRKVVFDGTGGDHQAGGESKQDETRTSLVGNNGANISQQQQQQQQTKNVKKNNCVRGKKPKQQDSTFLMDLLHLGETMDCSVLTLIPEALRGVHNSAPTEIKQQSQSLNEGFRGNQAQDKVKLEFPCGVGDYLDAPLLMPDSWKRPDYARRTLPELEQHVINQGRGGIRPEVNGFGRNRARAPKKNGKNGHHPKPPARKKNKTYELFTLMYNECSLTAIANWAMLGQSAPININNESKNEKWQKCKKAHEKRSNTDKARCKIMIHPPTFHLCGVCGGFGHYEVECEMLLDDDGKRKHAREETAVIGKRGERNKHLPKLPSGEKFVLDSKEKNSIISNLSKEVHVQRRQQSLYESYCEESKENVEVKNQEDHSRGGFLPQVGGSLPHAPLVSNTSLQHGASGDDQNNPGKHSYCKICLSGFDDGEMLLCDGCDELFHCKCLDPPLESIPEGDWFCSACLSYDSDASSIVDIEGCDGFVIEQRKRSMAEEDVRRRSSKTIGLGQSKSSSWAAALSLSTEQDPISGNELYIQKHLGRQYGHITEDFFLSELCWTKKRLGDQFEWWPAMVVNLETRSSRSSRKTTYTVKLFAMGDGEDSTMAIHETEILPFLAYYEDIGHKRLKRNDANEGFQRALTLCVSTLGLKSLGQALNVARDGIQMASVMKNEHLKLLPVGFKIPIGWESSDIDRIDGVVILAKEGGISTDHVTSPKRGVYEALGSMHGSNGRKGKNKRAKGDSSHSIEKAYTSPIQESSGGNKMISQFSVNEVLGSIVSWEYASCASSDSNSADIRYGVVSSINTETEMALVQTIPILSDSSSGNLGGLFPNNGANNDKELFIHASKVGSSIWIPLRHVRYVSGKPTSRGLKQFRSKLKSNMKREMESHAEQSKAEAKYREEFSIELVDLPLDSGFNA